MEDNFLTGLNGYYWWIGVVEDFKDPLKMGRLRVRIKNLHSDDVNLVPTNKLPWIGIEQSIQDSRKQSSVRIGDWVKGYFLDGKLKQQPIVSSYFPGIITDEYNQPADAPIRPTWDLDYAVGQPSHSRLSRGILEGTSINQTNSEMDHVCDISPYVRIAIAEARTEFSWLMDKIRNAIKSLLEQLGWDPSGELSWLISILKKIKNTLTEINKILFDIQTYKNEILDQIRRIRNIVAYILSLPARFAALLANCLGNILSVLGKALSDLFTIPGLETEAGSIGEVIDLLNQIGTEASTTINTTLDLATTPLQIASVILTSANTAEIEQASNTVNTFLTENLGLSNNTVSFITSTP